MLAVVVSAFVLCFVLHDLVSEVREQCTSQGGQARARSTGTWVVLPRGKSSSGCHEDENSEDDQETW